MIEYIRKTKNLRELFSDAESEYIEHKKIIQFRNKPKKVPREFSTNLELEPKPRKDFYQLLCDTFISELIKKEMSYDESLIRVKISFSKGEASYRLSFPILESGKHQSQMFVDCLKNAIKAHVVSNYSVHLSLKKEGTNHSIILMLNKVTTKYIDAIPHQFQGEV